MLITKLTLNYFGRFQNKEIELKPGINLLYGDNEAGKSTIHTFIRGMLFGIERLRGRGSASKEDTYTRYLPWDYPGAYRGSMEIRMGEKEYRLQRSFHANDKSFLIIDKLTGREVKLKEGLISELIPGLTESTFKNTISIEQLKTQTDTELAAQVRNYITNLSITKSKEVDVAKALSILTEKRKHLEISQNTTLLKTLQAEIEDCMEKEATIDQLSLQLKEYLAKEQELKEKRSLLEATTNQEDERRMEQLPAILEKYQIFQEYMKQQEILESQEKELLGKISTIDKEQTSTDSLKADFKEAELYRTNLLELQKKEVELQRGMDIYRNTAIRNRLITFLPAFSVSILLLIITGGQPFSFGGAAIILGAGYIAYCLLDKKRKHTLSSMKAKLKELQHQQSNNQSRLEQILKKYQVSRTEDLQVKQEEILKHHYTLENLKQQLTEMQQREKDLEDNLDLIYETIMKYMQHFLQEEELSMQSMQKLQEEIKRRKYVTQSRSAEINNILESYKLRIEKIRWEIGALEGNEDQLLKKKERYKELEQKGKENAVELEAVKLALLTIQELSTDIHDSFGHKLNQAVADTIREVTGEKYHDLKIDEKLEVKVGWKGDYILLDRLSAGTIDQVYFALRLAVADLLLENEDVPLLFDDSFAMYDESRVKASLAKISQRNQILLFTCHKREQELLQKMGLPYHLIDLSC